MTSPNRTLGGKPITTTSDLTPPAPNTGHTSNGDRSVPKPASRRPSATVAARRQIAERLRERREREEELIVAAADAVARRAAALEAAEVADQGLTAAIRDLQTMGFSLDDIAQVLEVATADLADQPSAGRARARPARADRHPRSRLEL